MAESTSLRTYVKCNMLKFICNQATYTKHYGPQQGWLLVASVSVTQVAARRKNVVTCLYIAWPKTLQLRYSTRCSTRSTTSSLATALNRSFFSPTHPPYDVHEIRYLESCLGLAAGYIFEMDYDLFVPCER